MLRIPLSSARWRIRILLWGGAVLAGLAVVTFAKLADLSLSFFDQLTAAHLWIALLITPPAGMLTVYWTNRYFNGTQGSGIPQVIAAARRAELGKPVGFLLSLRLGFGKVLMGGLGLAGGFSAGREGPSVQVAAAILNSVHGWVPHTRVLRQQDLILAGGAAGVAAAFNTPLAGIVFAIEELGRRLETRTSGVLLSTIIFSGLIAQAILGDYRYFGKITVPALDAGIVLPLVAAGLVCGVMGGLFSRLLLWPQMAASHALWRWRSQNPVRFAGFCGLAVALIGVASHGVSLGSGYQITSEVVAGKVVLPWYAPFARFLATVITYYSGIPGGIFAPALATGAALGSNVARLFGEGMSAAPVIALFMAAFLAAVTQSPITSAIIVMEMVDGHSMVLSLMAATLISNMVSQSLSRELYQHLALGWMVSPQERAAQADGTASSDQSH